MLGGVLCVDCATITLVGPPTDNYTAVNCGDTIVGSTTGGVNLLGNPAAEAGFTFSVVGNDRVLVDLNACESGYDTFLRIFNRTSMAELHARDDGGTCVHIIVWVLSCKIKMALSESVSIWCFNYVLLILFCRVL